MYEDLKERKRTRAVANHNRLRSGYVTESTRTLRPSQLYSKFQARTIRMTLRRIAFCGEYEDSLENRCRIRGLCFGHGTWAAGPNVSIKRDVSALLAQIHITAEYHYSSCYTP